MADKITFSIKDFRAIKEANIKLNGITVVSGINGCGKSTISKFLYYNFELANNYEDLVNEYLQESIKDIMYFIEKLRKEVLALDKDNLTIAYRYLLDPIHIYAIRDRESLLSMLNDLYRLYKLSSRKTEAQEKGLIGILKHILNCPDKEVDFPSLIEMLITQINKLFDEVTQILNHRPIFLLRKKLASTLIDYKLPGDFAILEYDNPIIDGKSETLPIIYSAQKVAYIDPSMYLGSHVDDQYSYNNNLNNILKKQPGAPVINPSIDEIIRKEIMQGEAKYDNDILFGSFTFTNNSGATYNLQDCATGLKAFSILQLMLRNGFLTPNTLLIIDEPEVHLHPQWIVEYARLIVLLNKEIGVNFFIASHNPDMVSAIKYISEKEKTTNKLNFYLAEEDDTDKGRYTYRALGTDIEPIFKSFNIALDKINEYGIADEDDVL